MFEWDKYSFIVSGGSRGLGKNIASLLAKNGAMVGVISRTHLDVPDMFSSRILHFQGDITDEEIVKNAFDSLTQTHQFYGFIHCAANLAVGEVDQYSLDDYSLVVDTQLKGAFLLSKTVYDYLKQRNEGVMIFIGSTLSHESAIESSLYVMAKHGLEGFAKALREDLFWSKIRVLTICPDDLDTSFIPGGPPHPSRAINAEELASFIVSLIPPNNTFYPVHMEIKGIPRGEE